MKTQSRTHNLVKLSDLGSQAHILVLILNILLLAACASDDQEATRSPAANAPAVQYDSTETAAGTSATRTAVSPLSSTTDTVASATSMPFPTSVATSASLTSATIPTNTPLTTRSLSDYAPILYAGTAGLVLMNADGSNPVNLTDGFLNDSYPAWAPDGSSIVFVRNHDIYRINPDGTALVNLTSHPSSDDLPVWSPDGTQIYFTSDRDGTPTGYLMNADGTGVHKPEGIPFGLHDGLSSSDGRKSITVCAIDGNVEICIAEQGKPPPYQNITNSPGFDSYGQRPWSPDDKHIVFYSERDGSQQVYVMDADGSNVIQLTTGSRSYAPTWSPVMP